MALMVRTSRDGVLRLAQAHRPIFYLPHVVADATGAFRRRSLSIELVPMATSGQWDHLAAGTADLAIGGPMRSMRLFEDGRRLVTFAAAVATSPWVLIGPAGAAAVRHPQELAGRPVLDDPEVATARLCLRGLLTAGTPPGAPQMEIRMVPRDSIVRSLAGGSAPFALMPYELTADPERRSGTKIVAELATWTGRVPWSSYQALPEVLWRRREEVAAFVDAIDEALRIIAVEPVQRLAELVAPWFARVRPPALVAALGGYRRIGVWPSTAMVPRDDFERFASLLVSAGWLREMPPYEELVQVVARD